MAGVTAEPAGPARSRGERKNVPGRSLARTVPARRARTYRSSDRTADVDWLACARAARPDWFRMLNRVRFADSSAMFASRMRLSAARVLVICDCARLTA